MKTVESRIDDFLSDTEGRPLRVAVGYTSVWGIAWLARRTQGRRVDLLIGNCSPLYLGEYRGEDLQRTRQNINEICDDKAWDAKDRLREYINR